MNSSAWGHMSGAKAVVDSLRRAEVSRVFGSASVKHTELAAAFFESSIELILVANSQCAAHMADAHSRVTGELSVCLLTPGQGVTDALGGIAEARLDSIAMIVLVVGTMPAIQCESHKKVADFDFLAGARAVCKAVLDIEEPEYVPHVLSSAVQLARGDEPGPVGVIVSTAVQEQTGRMEGTGFKIIPKALSDRAAQSLESVAETIKQVSRVGIYVGAGCLSATTEVVEMAEKLCAPVAVTLSGLGVVPQVHPCFAGFGPGSVSSTFVENLFDQCELVLAVGCKIHQLAAAGYQVAPPSKLVHIDIQDSGLADGRLAAINIVAPAKVGLRYLLDRIDQKSDWQVKEVIRAHKRKLRRALAQRPSLAAGVDPARFFAELRDLLSGEDVLVLDSGVHTFFGVACYFAQKPRTLLAPFDYLVSGFSIPAAVAAQIAYPEIKVVACIEEDGFKNTSVELLTARRCNVVPIVVVFSQEPSQIEQHVTERMICRESHVDLIPVDYEQYAHALNVGYIKISSEDKLRSGLKKALTMNVPVIIELCVSYESYSKELSENVNRWRELPGAVANRLGARYILEEILKSSSPEGEN
jgi:acetolactate synthase-1/2/3 large subunit